MKWKLWTVFAAAFLLAVLCRGAALADDSGSCGDYVNYSFVSSTGIMTISGTGAMADYTFESGGPWYAYRTSIRSIVVQSGVTGIGEFAFKDCTYLTAVTLPDTVTEIGSYAFYNCLKLTGLALPSSLTTIGLHAFSECDGLTDITIPGSVGRIQNGAFRDCKGLASVSISQGVTVIDGSVFMGCTALTDLTIPRSVTSIGTWAILNCSNLASVSILNPQCFISADSIRPTAGASVSLTIRGWDPSTAKTYAEQWGISFEPLGAVSGSCGEGVNWVFDPSDGRLSISGNGAIEDYPINYPGWYPIKGFITQVDIGYGVTAVGSYTFYRMNALTEATVPASVKSIGVYAFAYCDALESVTIKNPSCVIGDASRNVFNGAGGALTLRGWAGSTTKAYAEKAGIGFEPMGSLSGSCGENVSYLFNPTNAILYIYGTGPMEDYPVEWPEWYEYRDQINGVVVQDDVTAVGDFAFYGLPNLTMATVSYSVSRIGRGAYAYCASLRGVTFPASVTSIGTTAFLGCEALTSITFQNPDCDIGGGNANVFTNCAPSLTLRGWDGSTTQDYAQARGKGFESLGPVFTLPGSLTAIEAQAFQGIAARAVRIPGGVTDISGNPFAFSGVRFIFGAPGSVAQTFAGDYHYFFGPVSD